MRLIALIVLTAALHLSGPSQAWAAAQDLPGDRADAVAQGLMSPF